MKYLITTTKGLKSEINIKETPQINSTIQFEDDFYKVKDVIYFTDYTELKTIKVNLVKKPIIVKWN